MSRFADTVVIAGVEHSGCRALLIDGHELYDDERGNLKWALDSTLHEQTINTARKGAQFGIALGDADATIEIAKLHQTVNAVKSQCQTQSYFTLEWEDSQLEMDLKCVRDWTQQWVAYGKYTEGRIYQVVFRFAVKQAVSIELT